MRFWQSLDLRCKRLERAKVMLELADSRRQDADLVRDGLVADSQLLRGLFQPGDLRVSSPELRLERSNQPHKLTVDLLLVASVGLA
jgi:hypothetical protein